MIEAFQLTLARRHSNSEWPQWLHEAWNGPTNVEGTLQIDASDPERLRLILCTREGPQTISWDDWIIQGVNGELYPCKPDIFAKTYDAVEPCSEPKVRLPHMHFMAVSAWAPDRCFTMAECTNNHEAVGGYVLPLNKDGEYYDAYAVDVQRRGDPAIRPTTETVTLQKRIQGGEIQFVMTVAGREVVFVPQPSSCQLLYMGDESNDDFAFTLTEIDTLVDDSLDVLLEETGYVIVGRAQAYPEEKAEDVTSKT